MFTAIPWSEFVACRDFPGWLLQVRRPKSVGDLWGEIREIRFNGRELEVALSWTAKSDPRRGEVEKTGSVEPVIILPEADGPVYTVHVAFAVRDMHTGCECYIRHPRIALPARGRRRA